MKHSILSMMKACLFFSVLVCMGTWEFQYCGKFNKILCILLSSKEVSISFKLNLHCVENWQLTFNDGVALSVNLYPMFAAMCAAMCTCGFYDIYQLLYFSFSGRTHFEYSENRTCSEYTCDYEVCFQKNNSILKKIFDHCKRRFSLQL